MKRRLAIAFLGISGLALGCSTTGAVVTEPPATATVPTTPPPSATASVALPNASFAPVSATKPAAEAAAALAACHIGDLVPISNVSGMAQIASAADLVRYVPLTGREPQPKASGPAWIIQIHGDVQQMGGEVWTNPTCIVTSSESGYVATGPVTNTATGKTITPEAPKTPPDRPLPSLAP
jgi:hypothetical protein